MATVRKFILAFLFTAGLVLAVGAALFASDRALFDAAVYLVKTFTPYRLELEAPALDRRRGRLTADGVRLYQQGTHGPPLLAVQTLDVRNLLALRHGNLRDTAIAAASIQAFVDATDNTEDPTPEDWLRQTRWLPKTLSLGALHIINRGRDVQVVPVRAVDGRWTSANRYIISGRAELPRRVLIIGASMEQRDRASLALQATLSEPAASAVIALDGAVTATSDDLNYRLSVDGSYREVESLLEVLDPDAYGFTGALRLHGAMQGNLEAADLTITQLTLDNEPAYAFTASGSLHWRKASPVTTELSARGTMADLGPFAALVGTDLSALGRIDTRLQLVGTLSRPQVRQFSFTTRSEAGLALTLSPATDDLYLDETLPNDIALRVEASGPDPAVVSPWVPLPPLPAGPWTLTGTLRRQGAALAATDLDLVVRDVAGTGTVHMEGALTRLEPRADEGARFRGLNLRLRGEGLALEPLAEALETELPISLDGSFTAAAAITGDEGNLRLHGLDATVTALGGRTRIRGTVGRLGSLEKVDLRVEPDRLDPQRLGKSLPAALQQLLAGGRASGSLRLHHDKAEWRLDELILTLAGAERLDVTVSGSVEQLASSPRAQLEARYQLKRPENDTGLGLPPGNGTAVLDLAPGRQLVGLHAFLGATDLTSIVELTRDKGGISGLRAEVHAPRLHLPDLARVQARQRLAAQNGTAADERGTPSEPVFARVPAYPIELRLNIGDITGSNTRLGNFAIGLRGADRRFTLNRFDVDYAGGAVQLRGVADFSGEAAAISLAGEALRVPITALAADLGYAGEIEGTLSLRGGLTTQGSATEALVANVDGTLAGAVADGYVEGAAFDLLMTDLVSWLLLGGVLQENTNFECGMAQFLIEDGVARSEDIYLATKHMIAQGKATLDFPHKELDVRIDPRARSRTVQIPSSVRIRGSMKDPTIIPSPIAATFDASAKLLFLIPELGMKLFGIKPGNGDAANPCAAVLPAPDGSAR